MRDADLLAGNSPSLSLADGRMTAPPSARTQHPKWGKLGDDGSREDGSREMLQQSEATCSSEKRLK